MAIVFFYAVMGGMKGITCSSSTILCFDFCFYGATILFLF